MKTLTTPSETHAYFEQRSHDVDGELGDIDSLSCEGSKLHQSMKLTHHSLVSPTLYMLQCFSMYYSNVTMLQYVQAHIHAFHPWVYALYEATGHTLCHCYYSHNASVYVLLSRASLSSRTFLWLADCLKMPSTEGPSVNSLMSISCRGEENIPLNPTLQQYTTCK